MFNTTTNTATYTVTDIRKTFEGFSADFRMIALRTNKKTMAEVDGYIHDILIWAEHKLLVYVDITLLDLTDKPIKAVRYTVGEDGKAVSGERAGGNDWPNIPNTKLTVIVMNKQPWNSMTIEEKKAYMEKNAFKNNWGVSTIDNTYRHLSEESAQLYASKGYELQKQNFK